MHQFRIEAGVDNIGCPTPEGLHRDGVDWVSVMLIKRRNVQSGTTEIFYDQTKKSNKFTLTNPLDTVFLDDTRVRHGVTPISRLIQEVEGYRDVVARAPVGYGHGAGEVEQLHLLLNCASVTVFR